MEKMRKVEVDVTHVTCDTVYLEVPEKILDPSDGFDGLYDYLNSHPEIANLTDPEIDFVKIVGDDGKPMPLYKWEEKLSEK
jgi:hypothetical protein